MYSLGSLEVGKQNDVIDHRVFVPVGRFGVYSKEEEDPLYKVPALL